MPLSSGQDRDSRKRLLIALGGGGWHRELARILERFDPEEFQYLYVYGHHSGSHSCRALPVPHDGPRFPIRYPGPTRKTPLRFLANPLRLAVSFFEAFGILRKARPEVVLTLGSAIAIPLLVAAKVYKTKTIFIESLTRVEQLSLTGRIVHHLHLADRFYVQWARIAQRYPNTVFAGAVL